MTERVLLPQPGDTSLCEECGQVVECFRWRGLLCWRHVEDKSERHKGLRVRKDPRAWIVRE